MLSDYSIRGLESTVELLILRAREYCNVEEILLDVEWCGAICQEALVGAHEGRFPSVLGARVDVLVNACGSVMMIY
jgi:hypothetical protein